MEECGIHVRKKTGVVDEDVYSFESLQRLRYNVIRFRIGAQVAKGECRIRAFCSKCIQQKICLRGIMAMDNDSSALGANRLTTASPMPVVLPVTSALFPFSANSMSVFLFRVIASFLFGA